MESGESETDASGVDIIEVALSSFGFSGERAKVFAAVLVKVTPRGLQSLRVHFCAIT